jgi:hypothetical protein
VRPVGYHGKAPVPSVKAQAYTFRQKPCKKMAGMGSRASSVESPVFRRGLSPITKTSAYATTREKAMRANHERGTRVGVSAIAFGVPT